MSEMNTISVEPHKQWAIGMSQVQFENEFMIKYPLADYIPIVDEWLGMPKHESSLIDGINLENLQDEDMTEGQIQEKKEEEKKKSQPVYCRGCHMIFDQQKAKYALRKNHEKNCKLLKLKNEMEAKK